MSDHGAALREGAAWARDWLLGKAVPLWCDIGWDRATGGWVDAIDQSFRPLDQRRRARVQGRQAFVFDQVGRLFGWDGPWQDASRAGADYLLQAYRRDDGLYRTAVNADGSVADDSVDLYDQAFALLGFASAERAVGGYAGHAMALMEVLDATLYAGNGTGYCEAGPDGHGQRRSNPHMHLLEALLEWIEIGADPLYRTRAEEIALLAVMRMIDPATGAIGEYFTADWRFCDDASGSLREPGHQFEWSYLLSRADAILGGDRSDHADRLYAFGSRHGIDPGRGVAIFSLNATGRPVDRDARLWAQTEWLRAAITRGDEGGAIAALAAFRAYLEDSRPGLYFDRMKLDGRIVDAPAPASSLYHILTALIPLIHEYGGGNTIAA